MSFGEYQVFSARPGQPLTLDLNITGNPFPSVVLERRNGLEVSDALYQVTTNGSLQLAPVDEFNIYLSKETFYITATNCFSSVTRPFVLEPLQSSFNLVVYSVYCYRNVFGLLGNMSTDTIGGNVSALCGSTVNLTCNGSGNPIGFHSPVFREGPSVRSTRAAGDNRRFLTLVNY